MHDDPREYVKAIARAKMATIDWEQAAKGHGTDESLFFVSGDTLICTSRDQRLLGKPRNRIHAEEMLLEMGDQEIDVWSGMCVRVVKKVENQWRVVADEEVVSGARITYAVPKDMIESYLDNTPVAMSACGAAVVEGTGMQFFKSINGSFSATMGLDVALLAEKIRKHAR
jgi:septum formation protein